MAFYNECQHEFKPLTSGYCFALVYSLVYEGTGQCPSPASKQRVPYQFAGQLDKWHKNLASAPPKFVFLLENTYKKNQLKVQALTGKDKSFVEAMSEAIELEGKGKPYFEMYLASFSHAAGIMEYEEEAELYGADPTDDDSMQALKTMVSVKDGSKLQLSWGIDVNLKEMLPANFFEGKKPSTFEGGRDGLEPIFTASALVIWPIWMGRAFDTKLALVELKKMIEDKTSSEEDKIEFAKCIIRSWQTTVRYQQMVPYLTALGNKQIAQEFIGKLEGGTAESLTILLQLGGYFGLEYLESATVSFEGLGKSDQAYILLSLLVEPQGMDEKVKNDLSTKFAHILLDRVVSKTPTRFDYGGHKGGNFVSTLLLALNLLEDKAMLQKYLEHIESNMGEKKEYEYDACIIPAIQTVLGSTAALKGADPKQIPWVQELYKKATDYLRAEVNSLLVPPITNVSITLPNNNCPCPECKKIKTFLEDKNQTEYEYTGSGPQRNHVNSTCKHPDILMARIQGKNSFKITKISSAWNRKHKEQKEANLLRQLENAWNNSTRVVTQDAKRVKTG